MARALRISLAIAVGVLLLLAGGAMALPAQESFPQVSTTADSDLPNRLWVGTDAQTTTIQTHTDVGVGVDTAGTETEIRLREQTLQQRLEGATATERRIILNDEAEWLQSAAQTLWEQERMGQQRYVAGESDARTFMRTITATGGASGHYIAYLDTVEAEIEATSNMRTPDALTDAKARFEALHNPGREQLLATSRGETVPRQGYLAATSEQLRVATVDEQEQTFYADTYDWSNWDRTGDRQLEFTDVEGQFESLYPDIGQQLRWIVENPEIGTYEVGAVKDYAEVVVWFDSRTEAVYLEHQQFDLETIPTRTEAVETNDSLQLTVAQTEPEGPATVQLTDLSTSDPVDAQIQLNGQTIGQTGPNGQLWFVAPAENITVTATTEDRVVTATVDWNGS